jgi:hypothetical protein
MTLYSEIFYFKKLESCEDCGIKLEHKVLRTPAGYYVGRECNCGPWSRDSGYYEFREHAQSDLEADTWVRR